MPRRIPDYPDHFAFLNVWESTGAVISAFSIVCFAITIYDFLNFGQNIGTDNPWKDHNFTFGLFQKNISGVVSVKVNTLKILSEEFERMCSFTDPATSVMEGMLNLHHDILFIMIVITVFVVWLIYRTVYFFNSDNNQFWFYTINNDEAQYPSNNQHNSFLEIVWTIIPCVILLFISVPSFCLLYAVDDCKLPWWTVKVIGNQWYWSYEINSNILLNTVSSVEWTFDSYMQLTDTLFKGHFRLLEVDWRLALPKHCNIRMLITSTDVLHSWSLPAAGIKVDACPGRLNEVYLNMKRDGVFFGQCSEICGLNHGFMPIVVVSF